MLPDAPFSCTKCAGPTITPTGTICILFVCLTTRMNPTTQSAQPWRSLYFVGITNAFSWTWGRNTHCWVFLHLFEMVDIAFPACRRSWNWRIWFGGVQLKYNTGMEGTRPWKVLSRSFSWLCIYWTKMLWASGIIPWFALVYSILPSSPRRSTEVGLWKWLTIIQQPILEVNKYTVYEYILIISIHEPTNFISPVLFNLRVEYLSKVGNSEIFWCISEWG